MDKKSTLNYHIKILKLNIVNDSHIRHYVFLPLYFGSYFYFYTSNGNTAARLNYTVDIHK